MNISDLNLIISLIVTGFFGGFAHCFFMCGPFAVSQSLSKLSYESCDRFLVKKIRSSLLLSYHLGRATTYSALGIICSSLKLVIQEVFAFKHLASFLLFVTATLLLLSVFKSGRNYKASPIITLPKATLQKLFNNPFGTNGFMLGMVLGMIPCGMLYSALLLSVTFENPLLAGLGMFLFGLSNFPALFLASFGSNILVKFSGLKMVMKFVIVINALTLLLMAIKLYE